MRAALHRFDTVGGHVRVVVEINRIRFGVLQYILFLPLHQCVLNTVYTQYFSEFCVINPEANHSGGIRTHDLCIARADVYH